MRKKLEKYPEIISIRLTQNEKWQFNQLMRSRQTNGSEFLRGKIKRILRTLTVKI
ncbi:MAG: hypothetical protein ABSF81_07750 [Bacteroidales bacterium]|jgi:hypothetical protein